MGRKFGWGQKCEGKKKLPPRERRKGSPREKSAWTTSREGKRRGSLGKEREETGLVCTWGEGRGFSDHRT